MQNISETGREKYEPLEVEVITFELPDIITKSDPVEGPTVPVGSSYNIF